LPARLKLRLTCIADAAAGLPDKESRMRVWAVALVSILVAGCATGPIAPRADQLFKDHLFAPASERVSADAVFALSDDMKRYINEQLATQSHAKGPQRALLDALYSKHQLKLVYDAEMTRNAAQTFTARAGNCLSLVLMTAAFAKELDVPVRYQIVLGDTVWSRSGGMYFSISHVNLTLGKEQSARILDAQTAPLTVDFLPGEDIRGERLRVVSEQTIVAMYMNNRAAELLAQGQIDDAYWWVRAAVGQDPKFLSAYNTLGVIYRRHGNAQEANQVLSVVLELEPGNTQAMSNLALVLNDQGHVAEAMALTRKLELLQPFPPFYYFELGLAAMRRSDYNEARLQFEKEVERDAYYHEFRAWLAAAYLGLGETTEARAQLSVAMENSATRAEHDLYAAKLDRIASQRFH
jgi:tetratricopeptide (TPR) repeat protein